MKILLAGDVHGKMHMLIYAMKRSKLQIPEIEKCIQVGDFGFYPSIIEAYLREKGFPYQLMSIDGNHEDHEWLQKCFDNEKSKEKNLEYISRGTVIDFDGRKVGFIGGAMNVDRPQEGKVKFGNHNFISNEDVKNALNEFNKYKLDMIISHSCPHGIGIGINGHPSFTPYISQYILKPYGLEPTDITDCGEHALKDLWDGLDHKPKNWVFGHFHSFKDTMVGDTRFMCIGSTDTTDSKNSFLPFIYDTIDNEIAIGDNIPFT